MLPQHFHPRWWMLLSYDCDQSSTLQESVSLALRKVRDTAFENGKYKGIYVGDPGKIQNQTKSPHNYDIVQRFYNYLSKAPLVINSKSHFQSIEGIVDKLAVDEDSFHDFDFGMGGSSEGFVSLSSTNLTLRDSDLEEELYISGKSLESFVAEIQGDKLSN